MERRELPRYPVIDAAATGRNLRRLRLEKGYSVKELQEYLGLSCPQGVYQWQAGRSLPSVDNLYAVSRLWGVSMNASASSLIESPACFFVPTKSTSSPLAEMSRINI